MVGKLQSAITFSTRGGFQKKSCLVFHHEEMRVYAERGAICSRTDGRERIGKKRSREREEENVLAYVSPDFCPMPVLIHT